MWYDVVMVEFCEFAAEHDNTHSITCEMNVRDEEQDSPKDGMPIPSSNKIVKANRMSFRAMLNVVKTNFVSAGW